LAEQPCALLVLTLLLAGCSRSESGFGFRLEQVDSRVTTAGLEITVHQKLALSREASDALEHGVPLSLQTAVSLRTASQHRDIEQQHRNFEIRYLPLSKRYQLTVAQPFSVSTFPRLRHVLTDLATVTFTLGPVPMPASACEIRVRTFLDTRHMPPPMRLPARFSSRWRHDSGWQAWPLAAGGEPSTREHRSLD
jgi:hypothetical protein